MISGALGYPYDLLELSEKAEMRASITTIRTCIVCRKTQNSADLLRVNLRAGVVTPVQGRKTFGRGAWLHFACGYTAIERKAFKWAFRLEQAPDVSQLKAFLDKRLQEMDAKDMKLK